MESLDGDARAGMLLGRSALNLGEGTLILLPGVEMRGCWSLEGM